jgi:oxygen-independent coproporphyrinogen-3 oxidase
MIEALMCDFRIDAQEFIRDHGFTAETLAARLAPVAQRFTGMVALDETGLTILPQGQALTRMIARMFDAYDLAASGHSPAI